MTSTIFYIKASFESVITENWPNFTERSPYCKWSWHMSAI